MPCLFENLHLKQLKITGTENRANISSFLAYVCKVADIYAGWPVKF